MPVMELVIRLSFVAAMPLMTTFCKVPRSLRLPSRMNRGV